MPHLPRLALTGLAALLPLAGQTLAQPASHTAATAAYAAVAKSCVPEAQRLCPSFDAVTPQPRSMAICLRPYKSSLSLQCRQAIKAVAP